MKEALEGEFLHKRWLVFSGGILCYPIDKFGKICDVNTIIGIALTKHIF